MKSEALFKTEGLFKKHIAFSLFLYLLLVNTNVFSQAGILLNKIPDKDERRLKQIEKSPAKEEIKFVESEMDRLKRSFKSSEWDNREEKWMKVQKDYDAVQASIKKMEEAVAQIKVKDPKWAGKNDYAPGITEVTNSYNTKLTAFREWEKVQEENNFIEKKEYAIRTTVGRDLQGLYNYEKFHRLMFEELKYTETKNKIAELVAKDPTRKENYYYKGLAAFYEKDFPEFATKDLPESIEKKRKEATELGAAQGLEKVKELIGYCTDMQQLVPEEKTRYGQILLKLEELKAKQEASLEKIYTSAFHKAHVGQLLFSNKPIVVGQEKEEDFKTSFKAGESIYAIYYRSSESRPSYSYQLFIDNQVQGQSSAFSEGQWKDDVKSLSYFTFAIIPDPDQPVPSPTGLDALMVTERILSYLKTRTEFADKKVKVTFAYNTTDGPQFEIDYSNGLAEFEAKLEKIKTRRASEIRIPKPNTGNAEIIAAWKKAVLEPGETVVMVNALDGAWQYRKSRAGIITERYAAVWGVVKTKKGECVLLGGIVSQDKGDSGYGTPMMDLEEEYFNNNTNTYKDAWDGVKRVNGTEGFKCDCNLVGK